MNDTWFDERIAQAVQKAEAEGMDPDEMSETLQLYVEYCRSLADGRGPTVPLTENG